MPMASPCSTRPANSSGTDSVNENTSDAVVITSIAGIASFLRPRRSDALPASSMVGTTVAVYVANRSISTPFDSW